MAAGDLTPGRRIYGRDKYGDGHLWYGPFEPGDYWRDENTGDWFGATPRSGDHVAGLANHDVVEHEDGTITVSPSILAEGQWTWHGYLEGGVWREV
jgi:hypothetical protein